MRRRPTAVNPLPSARDLALGKAGFTVKWFDGASLPSVALGKGFAECMGAFAECMGHSAKRVATVVNSHFLNNSSINIFSPSNFFMSLCAL